MIFDISDQTLGQIQLENYYKSFKFKGRQWNCADKEYKPKFNNFLCIQINLSSFLV